MSVSVSVVPFAALSVKFTSKPKASTAAATDPEPSLGIATYGDTVTFTETNMASLVYLTCESTFNTTSATALIVLEGDAKAVYALS